MLSRDCWQILLTLFSRYAIASAGGGLGALPDATTPGFKNAIVIKFDIYNSRVGWYRMNADGMRYSQFNKSSNDNKCRWQHS